MVRVDTAATRRYLKYSTSLVMIKKEKLALLLSFWCQAHLGLKYFVPRHKLGMKNLGMELVNTSISIFYNLH